jgi:hypothetical protein
LESLPSFSTECDGRDHQWQAPPLGVRSPPLAFLPLALFKHALELLHSPLHP